MYVRWQVAVIVILAVVLMVIYGIWKINEVSGARQVEREVIVIYPDYKEISTWDWSQLDFTCGSDTECMELYGGNGDPEPIGELTYE